MHSRHQSMIYAHRQHLEVGGAVCLILLYVQYSLTAWVIMALHLFQSLVVLNIFEFSLFFINSVPPSFY